MYDYEDALREMLYQVYRNTDDFEMRISKECYKKIITALEKQLPKKPYKRKEGKETNYYCLCEHYLGDEAEIQLIAIRPRFCDNCGQALNWSDTNG